MQQRHISRKRITSIFLKGLAAVVPSIITLYILWACIEFLELSLRSFILLFIEDWEYIPGSGLALFLTLIVICGLSIQFSPLRYIFLSIERRIMEIPLAKSIYGGAKDMMGLFSDSPDLTRPVLVPLADGRGHVVGFLTCAEPQNFIGEPGQSRVAVYCPMSYQIGGYTILIEREALIELQCGKEDLLRFVLTAGVSQKTPEPKAI